MTAPAHRLRSGGEYRHPRRGKTVVGVTTAIGAAVAKTDVMVGWSAKMCAEYITDNRELLTKLNDDELRTLVKRAPRRSSEAAANQGSTVHRAAQAIAEGRPTPKVPDNAQPYVEQFQAFIDTVKPKFVETEVTVWNDRFQYAGTADWIADIDGAVTLGDSKTGRGVYPEAALQLTALAHGEFILRNDGREDPIPNIDQLAVLHIRPDSWSLIPVRQDPDTWRAFLGALAIHKWTSGAAKTVLGSK